MTYTGADNYKNFKAKGINLLDKRAYFIPFSNRKSAEKADMLNAERASRRVISLNGKWDFIFFPKGHIPSRLNRIDFEKIDVPSCWQIKGYEAPYYLSDRYMFNCVPPAIPSKDSVGLYRDGKSKKLIKAFDIHNSAAVYRKTVELYDMTDKAFILSFLGVSSCFDLYVNGKFAGYAEDSYSRAEFDVTPYLAAGMNEIIVIVRKWSSSSYLECHDTYRLNGIYRDVMLFCNNKSHIFDFEINSAPINDKGSYQVNIAVKVRSHQGHKLRVSLEDKKGGVKYISLTELSAEETLFSFQDKFEEYSSECPNLYKLYISLVKDNAVTECAVADVGFKRVEIKGDGAFYLNGKPVKINGINYQEWSPMEGWYLKKEKMLEDIELIKQHNFNAVRITRPAHPLFYQLCALKGLYVIAEAGIDTSGTAYSPFNRPNLISKKSKWQDRFLSRTEAAYHLAKNCASTIMYGLGSRSGGIANQQSCYDYLKKRANAPVYYEGAAQTKQTAFDIYALRSMSLKELAALTHKGNKGKPIPYGKPIFITELASIKGVCGGGLKEYYQIFESSERFMGGCVSWFADFALYRSDSPYRFSYAGDFNEFIHDSSLCLGGLFSPDRKPRTAALNIKHILRPVRAALIDDKTIEFFNTRYFKDTSDIKIILSMQDKGQTISRTEINATIPPRQKRKYDIFLENAENKDMFLNIFYADKASGEILAKEQIALNQELPAADAPEGQKIALKDLKEMLIINFENGFLRMDKTTGGILDYQVNGAEYVRTNPARAGEKSFYTNILRADTERDRAQSKKKKSGRLQVELRELSYKIREEKEGGNRCEIVLNNAFIIDGKECFVSQDMFVVYPSGRLDIYSSLHPRRKNPGQLQTFGKVIKMPPSFTDITYYGMGPGENYPDMKEHCLVGIYDILADEFCENYIRPQESGNRCDTRYAIIKNDMGEGLLFMALARPFNFKVNPHSREAINSARHIEDLRRLSAEKGEGVYVYLDSETSGIGLYDKPLNPKHKIPPKESYIMGFSVIPFIKADTL
ncbi:MAG: hypothetical protein GX353_10040 [Oligella ureolytica]|jgi:beta-galactosidase|nr:hypothetical protein [Oligella ureolytica]HHT83094.1 hypothetical protein [Clostridiales bacterium]